MKASVENIKRSMPSQKANLPLTSSSGLKLSQPTTAKQQLARASYRISEREAAFRQSSPARASQRVAEQVNHKQLLRIYREAALMLRHKKRNRCVRACTQPGVYSEANQE